MQRLPAAVISLVVGGECDMTAPQAAVKARERGRGQLQKAGGEEEAKQNKTHGIGDDED